MKWMDVDEINKKYGDDDYRKSFVRLYAIQWLLKGGLVTKGYKPNIRIKEVINLNTEGEKLASIIEKDLKSEYQPPRPGDIKHSLADISRARAIGYEPQYSLDSG